MPVPLRGRLRTPRSASLVFRSIPCVTGRRWQATESATVVDSPPPAGGHSAKIGESKLLRGTRDLALRTPGIMWTDENAGSTGLVVGKETQKMNMYSSIREALHTALTKDETAVVFGEDVSFGGVFRCTMGLAQEFGRERVFNTPLTEQGIVGFGIGLASMGQTAIAEIQFSDYIFPAFDQLVNEAAKFRYRSGGQFNCGGLTVRSPCMAVGHGGLYHSQSPEGFFLGAHGLKIVIPRSPIQAKGLLLASIREQCPTLFFEPKILYRSAVEQVPVDDYTLPLSKIETLIHGSDLTVLSYGAPIYTCENAISLLNAPPPELDREDLVPKSVRGARVELIDLRTIVPWDMEGVMESVKRTGRLVIVHEAGRTGGVGADIATEVQKRLFLRLEAPVKIVAGWDTPVGLAYEKFYMPDAIRVLDGLIETLKF